MAMRNKHELSYLPYFYERNVFLYLFFWFFQQDYQPRCFTSVPPTFVIPFSSPRLFSFRPLFPRRPYFRNLSNRSGTKFQSKRNYCRHVESPLRKFSSPDSGREGEIFENNTLAISRANISPESCELDLKWWRLLSIRSNSIVWQTFSQIRRPSFFYKLVSSRGTRLFQVYSKFPIAFQSGSKTFSFNLREF